jgi:MYXO-CTERM domain-containing protein
MPRRHDHEDDWEEEFDSEDEEPTVPCPSCRRPIHEDSPRCPHCGHYVSEEDAPPGRKPWWLVLGALAALYAVYRWIAG